MAQKVAFITGANRGIGFQTALDLGKDPNVKVVIGARDAEQGRQAVEKLRAAAVDADFLEFDVTNSAHIDNAYKYFESNFGRLDILVNNAGVAAGGFPPVGPEHSTGEVPLEILRRVFETNFFAPIALTQKLLPLIKKSPAGRIVNLSSILGSLALHADPNSGIYHAKSFAYDASKTALNAFTIHLALRTARYQHQGQQRASRLGQDRHGRRTGSYGTRRWLEDQRGPRHPTGRGSDRRLLPPGPAASVVMHTIPPFI